MESNMIKTAICDNNLNNAIIIKNSIEQFSNKFRLRCDISIYTSGNELIIDHHKYKAIFINTNIKDKSADNIARYIRMSGEKTRLIFISDNERTACQIIKYQPFGFIHNINLQSELTELLPSLFLEINGEDQYFTFKSESGTVNLKIKDINYFETFGHVIEINTDNKVIPIRTTLKLLEDKFKGFGFFRIHKSYLVNVRSVFSVNRHYVTLNNMKTLPIGNSRTEVLNNIIKYRFAQHKSSSADPCSIRL